MSHLPRCRGWLGAAGRGGLIQGDCHSAVRAALTTGLLLFLLPLFFFREEEKQAKPKGIFKITGRRAVGWFLVLA